MLKDFHIYFVRSPCRVSTPLHCFHANSVAKWQPADRFPMSPCAEGPRAHKTGRFEVLRLPGASAGFWLYDHPSLQNTMTAKERRDMGTRAYAVYMQFLWTAEGVGTRRAIKILQINYTKKKRQIIYIRNLYKAFTSPSSFVRILRERRGRGLQISIQRAQRADWKI